MKRLRVLTGCHSGTDLLLSPATYGISADAQADIRITDWNGEPLVLELKDEGDQMSTATYRWGESEATASFADLLPKRFADVVLCLGPATGQPWPSDVTLLDRLLQRAVPVAPPPAPASRPAAAATPPWQRWLLWGSATAAVVVGGVFFAVVSAASRAAGAHPPPSLLARAQIAIDRSDARGVVARPTAGGVVVEGILPSSADVSRLRIALEELPEGSVVHRYAAAAELAQSIAEALGAPDIRVRQTAPGVFLVEGSAVHAALLQNAANRVINDLAPLVRSIDVAVTDLPPPPKQATGAMLQTTGLEYVQTRDGTKHLSLMPRPVDELKDAPNGNTPPLSARTDSHSSGDLK